MQTTSQSFKLGLFILCACFFMTTLDMTIVNVALPSMTSSLSAPLDQVIWVVNAYLLIYAALSIPSGRLGDIIGQRNIFVLGLGLFTVASVLCGLSQNIFELIGARILQGIGSAFITATSLALLAAVVPPARRGTAMGIYAGMAALASVVGPIVGGLIISTLGWQWIFYVNLPIGIALFIGILTIIPNMKIEKQHRFDIVGIILATVGLFCIVFALVEGQTFHWGEVIGPLSIPVFFIGGVVILIAFVFWERFQTEPFLPLTLFKNWTFSSMVLVNSVLAFAHFGTVFLLTLYFQSALGMSAFVAGLTIVPEMVAILVVSPFAGRLSDEISSKYVLIVGLFFFAVGLSLFAWLSTTSSNWLTFLVPLIIAGVGVGCSVGTVMSAAMSGVAPPMMGTASGVISTTRQVGGSIGVAVITGFLQSRLLTSVNDQVAATTQKVPADQHQSFINYLAALIQNNKVAHSPLSATIQQLAHQIYDQSFVAALHPTLLVVVAVLILGIVLSFTVSGGVSTKKASKLFRSRRNEKVEVVSGSQSAS